MGIFSDLVDIYDHTRQDFEDLVGVGQDRDDSQNDDDDDDEEG